jgi:hypothetical protein
MTIESLKLITIITMYEMFYCFIVIFKMEISNINIINADIQIDMPSKDLIVFVLLV